MGKFKQAVGVFRPAKAALVAVVSGIILAGGYLQTVQQIVTDVLKLPVGVIQAIAVLVILAMLAVMFHQNQRPREERNGELAKEIQGAKTDTARDFARPVMGIDENGYETEYTGPQADFKALEAKVRFLENELDEARRTSADPIDAATGLRVSEYRGKVGSLEGKVDFLEMSWRTAHEAQAELKRQLAAVETALAQEREAHRQTKQESESRWYWIRYDIRERRTFPELTPVALEVAHNDMKRVRDVMAAAGRGALDLLVQVGEPLSVGPDEKNKLLASLVSQHRFVPAGHLYERLFEELGPPGVDQRVDYREWLIHWYEAYNELRRTIVQLADFAGVKLTDLLGYGEWRKHDRLFLEKVADIGVMHDAIKAVNRHRRYPLPMPD